MGAHVVGERNGVIKQQEVPEGNGYRINKDPEQDYLQAQ